MRMRGSDKKLIDLYFVVQLMRTGGSSKLIERSFGKCHTGIQNTFFPIKRFTNWVVLGIRYLGRDSIEIRYLGRD